MASLHTPQQLLSPPPSPAPQNLSTEINIATRQIHTRLNKLITSRLPLALPSLANNPSLYAHGINHFGDVYLTFENCWNFLIAEASKLELDESSHEHKVRQWLCALVPAGLWRSDAVKKDLEQLERVTGTELEVAESEKLQSFTEQIYSRTRAKPHVLVAYSWIMYMAIFSGGRWIREQLTNAGPEFWGLTTESEKLEYWITETSKPGFSLFYFSGSKDGEDIKADFKSRLEDAESLLLQQERKDIIDEAQFIFEQCVGVVEGLDDQLKSDLSLIKNLADSEAKHESNPRAISQATPLSPSVESNSGNFVRALVMAFVAVLCYYFYYLQHGHEEYED